MENALEILVIILSTMLALVLLLGIVLLIILVKIAGHIRRISAKAEMITDRAEDIADFFSKAATPLAAGKIISVITDVFKNRSKKSKD